ncbi:MAG: hypothetical protein WDO17_25505 [Alphaproteobacteria bacterium]
MKTLIATIFVLGASLTALSSAQAMSVAPLAEAAKDASAVVQVAKACRRGYRLTPHGCRKISHN